MNNSTIKNVAPSPELKSSVTELITLSTTVQRFQQNVSFSSQFAHLTGQAQSIATNIEQQLLPAVIGNGQHLESFVQNALQSIKQLSIGMYRCFRLSMKVISVEHSSGLNNVDKVLINNFFDNAISASESVNSSISNLLNQLNTYHTSINNLVSALKEEKLALDGQQQQLLQERDQVLQKLHDQTHTVCGVVKTIVDALTFQLQSELQSEEAEIAQDMAKYRANSIAIGTTQVMQSDLQTLQSQLQGQQKFWSEFTANLGTLKSDLDGTTQNPSVFQLEFTAVEQDWETLGNMIQ